MPIFQDLSCFSAKHHCTFNEVTGSIDASKGDTFDTFERDTFCIAEGENDLLSCFLHGFTTSFADVDSEELNSKIHFNTNSIFYVCDNSTTGQICNDVWKFNPSTLWQINKSLTAVYGTGSCLQEGTGRVQLVDFEQLSKSSQSIDDHMK